MVNVAGIDYSSKAIDVVWLNLDDDAATWFRYPLIGQDAFDRARNVRAAFSGSRKWEDTLAVGLEQPRGNFGTVAVARIQGAILACLPAPLLVQPWNPSAWRKAVGLPGNCPKWEVETFARSHTAGTQQWPQDAMDAYCIALATRAVLERSEAA